MYVEVHACDDALIMATAFALSMAVTRGLPPNVACGTSGEGGEEGKGLDIQNDLRENLPHAAQQVSSLSHRVQMCN